MKKCLIISVSALVTLSLWLTSVNAQMMGRVSPGAVIDDHTAREEAEGKKLWEKLQAKQVACADLSREDFGALGEYFMGQMLGDTETHAAMNQMMIRMMDEEGEEQMHVVMGKRLSGCDPTATLPSGGFGFMPMMQMMTGWGRGGWGMMPGSATWGWGSGVGTFAAISLFLWLVALPLVLTILTILLAIKVWQQIKK